jgi:AcrR family transcriptional regulator
VGSKLGDVKITFDRGAIAALSRAMAKQKRYHHGDLRQALVAEALGLLEEGGLEGLSLRKIAARAGVSHAAPEHHFPTLRHLLNGLATEGFKRFAASMREEMQASPAVPADQLRAATRGYLAFAVSQPHLFRLMFSANRLDWSDAELGQAATASRGLLSDICRPVAAMRGMDTPEGRACIEQLVWSQIHGYSHLVIDGKFPQGDGSACEPHVVPLDLAGLLLA